MAGFESEALDKALAAQFLLLGLAWLVAGIGWKLWRKERTERVSLALFGFPFGWEVTFILLQATTLNEDSQIITFIWGLLFAGLVMVLLFFRLPILGLGAIGLCCGLLVSAIILVFIGQAGGNSYLPDDSVLAAIQLVFGLVGAATVLVLANMDARRGLRFDPKSETWVMQRHQIFVMLSANLWGAFLVLQGVTVLIAPEGSKVVVPYVLANSLMKDRNCLKEESGDCITYMIKALVVFVVASGWQVCAIKWGRRWFTVLDNAIAKDVMSKLQVQYQQDVHKRRNETEDDIRHFITVVSGDDGNINVIGKEGSASNPFHVYTDHTKLPTPSYEDKTLMHHGDDHSFDSQPSEAEVPQFGRVIAPTITDTRGPEAFRTSLLRTTAPSPPPMDPRTVMAEAVKHGISVQEDGGGAGGDETRRLLLQEEALSMGLGDMTMEERAANHITMSETDTEAWTGFYRLCVLLSIPVGIFYLIWLGWPGGVNGWSGMNKEHPIPWALFLGAETLNFFLGLAFNSNMWSPKKLIVTPMSRLESNGWPREDWPEVDAYICHYREPVEDTMATMQAAMEMDYPPEKLHVWILDDGHFAEDKGAHTVHVDMMGLKMVMAADACIRGADAPAPYPCGYWVKSVHRDDTCYYSLRYDWERNNGLKISILARFKQGLEDHHYKAGNINNALFNHPSPGQFIAIFDNDMMPRPHFLTHIVPCFFKWNGDNQVFQPKDDLAFVQTPQMFNNIYADDPMGHRNSIFFHAVQLGRSGIHRAGFAGTNAMFSKAALERVRGLMYNTVTEDAATGILLHEHGYDSLYLNEDLAVGTAPESVANSMQQRQRWVTGSVEITINNHFPCCIRGLSRKVNLSPPPPRGVSESILSKLHYLDGILYPYAAFSAIAYMVVALLYLYSPDWSPIQSGMSLLYTFLPYFILRVMVTYSGYQGVMPNWEDVWRSSQVYFAYASTTVTAIFIGFFGKLFNIKLAWGNTGAGISVSSFELFNMLMVPALFGMLVWNMVQLFSDKENLCNPGQYLAAEGFGWYIMAQLWPMTSRSFSKWRLMLLGGSGSSESIRPFRVPTFFKMSVLSLASIVLLIFWNKTKCIPDPDA